MPKQFKFSIATFVTCAMLGALLVAPGRAAAQQSSRRISGGSEEPASSSSANPSGEAAAASSSGTKTPLMGPRFVFPSQTAHADDSIVISDDAEENAAVATDGDSVPAPRAHTALSQTKLSAELIDLRDRLRRVLTVYYPKHLNSQEHSPWEMMHGIISYGVDSKVFVNQPGGKTANSIGWMCFNQPCHGEQIFYLDRGNKLVARKGPGLQGHLGQFMAIIAQAHVPTDFPMKIGGKDFTIQDLIEHEKQDCRAGEELTFKLIGLSHYLDSDETWKSANGQTWSIPRLIQEELKQPILRVAACGGTHRLMGHSYALYKRRKQGKPINGQFARAEKFISDYHKYSYSLQNSDGSFSTKWFEMREARADIDRRLKTSGHIFEWMAFSVPEEQLRDPRMVKAANYLVNLLASQPNRKWEVGPWGHALHALRIYDRRLFKPYDAQSPTVPTPTAGESTEPLARGANEDEVLVEDNTDEFDSAPSANSATKRPAAQPTTTNQSKAAGSLVLPNLPIKTARKPSPPLPGSAQGNARLGFPNENRAFQSGLSLERPSPPIGSAATAPDVPPIELLP